MAAWNIRLFHANIQNPTCLKFKYKTIARKMSLKFYEISSTKMSKLTFKYKRIPKYQSNLQT